MSQTLEVSASRENGITVIALVGSVDAHTAPDFESVVQSSMEAEELKIVVDCTRLEYISSAGLGVFMGYVEDLRDAGGDMKIGGLSDAVADVFDLLGFSEIFDVHDKVGDAAKAFEA